MNSILFVFIYTVTIVSTIPLFYGLDGNHTFVADD